MTSLNMRVQKWKKENYDVTKHDSLFYFYSISIHYVSNVIKSIMYCNHHAVLGNNYRIVASSNMRY